MGEYHDFLPVYGFMPDLTDAEVERFAALGEEGWDRFRSGDDAGAEAAFRAQLGIFAANPEPFVSLALLEASRGAKKAAAENLRAAVLRGFTDLRRIDRAEAWIPMRGNLEYHSLQDAVRILADVERKWANWSSFRAGRAPEDPATVMREHADSVARIDRMAPAFGPRLARLWNRLFECVSASRLEAYVAKKPQAPDLGEALDQLMTFYTGGPLIRWELLETEAARRLAAVSDLLLERFPESPLRPNALVGSALARNSDRDERGTLRGDAAEEIRVRLDEVLARHPDSPVVATAEVGLILTEMSVGLRDRAAARYRQFREDRNGDPLLLSRVQESLGELALRLGGLPEFRSTTLDGETIDAEALRGKVAVLDFWATWCRPCVDEFPVLRSIDQRHGEEVVLLGVNLDSAEELAVEDLRRWVASQGVPGSHLHDGLSWDSELVSRFGVREIPFNVVVGPDGAVLAVNEHGKRLKKAVNDAVRSASEGRTTATTAPAVHAGP